MKMLKNIAGLLLILIVSSCGNLDNNSGQKPASTVQLLNQDGKVLYVLNGDTKRLTIESIIASKKLIMKKILPVFTMKLVIENGDEKNEWMVAKPNYIKSVDEKQSQIYVVNKNLNLFEQLKLLSE